MDAATQGNSADIEITPLVKSLSGIITVDADHDFKKDFTDYLFKKYK